MKILDQMYGPHLGNLSRALGKTSERFGVISTNLANVNTPGYKRQDVDFAIELDRQSSARSAMSGWNRLGGARQGALRQDGNGVSMEQEMVAMAETEARYRLLSEMTNRYFTGLKSVIREGR